MTSGVFHLIPISKITVLRDTRQRRELEKIDELADSIKRLGLINPITVTRDLTLVAGERRLEAHKTIGADMIACQYVDEADDHTVRAIELEENIKRVELAWQDRCRAIQEYHAHQKAENAKWTYDDTAAAIGVSKVEVHRQLEVAKELAVNPKVAQAPKFSVASGIVTRANERKDEQTVNAIRAIEAAPKPAALPDSIVCANFNEWAPGYSGPRFNFIHCDFPYGINMERSDQGSGAAHGAYDDSPDTYWRLLDTLSANVAHLTTESCHLMFWFSMKYYKETLDILSRDWVVDPFPLIWMKSDNVGILPDPNRGPRRVYETAFLARRGDRKVVSAVANAYSAPSVRDRHMSEKSEPMLRHFFGMLVDENSVVLDPTAGSGSALRAAESRGAKHVLGLELNPEFARIANDELNKARRLRNVK